MRQRGVTKSFVGHYDAASFVGIKLKLHFGHQALRQWFS